MSRILRLRPTLLAIPSSRPSQTSIQTIQPAQTQPRQTATTTRPSSSFSRGPSPPRLPAAQQAEFERLQRAASVSSAFQHLAADAHEPNAAHSGSSATSTTTTTTKTTTPATASPRHTSSPTTAATSDAADTKAEQQQEQQASNPAAAAAAAAPPAVDEETMQHHPAYVRGAPPEFQGDVNPRTGEIGGPKREPLRWGARGDWSYNGRVTDF